MRAPMIVRGGGQPLENKLKELADQGWCISSMVGCRCCDAVVILVNTQKEAEAAKEMK